MDVIMFCLVGAIKTLQGPVIDEYTAMVET
jgi:hypothetical protein